MVPRLRDVLASVGVIGSLIFVGLEVRQNTKAVQATAIQNLSDAFREHTQLYVTDPDMTGIVVRANQDLSSLTTEELQRFFGSYVSGTLTVQGAYRQWQLGVLPDEEWAVVRARSGSVSSADRADSDTVSPSIQRSSSQYVTKRLNTSRNTSR